MKTIHWLLVLVWLTALTVFAQTNSVPTFPGASSTPPDASLAKLLLAVIVPLIVAGIKKVVPKIPKASIPPLAIALGALADWGGSLAGVWNGNMVVGMVLGASSVGVREAAVKLGRAVMKPEAKPD